jgi:rhodanese-related sulfurtransferase
MAELARLTPAEIQDGIENGTMVLIDVREPLEFAEARIPGALLFPLSTFDAHALPDVSPKKLVFSCRSGKRSMTAFNAATQAGIPTFGHLEGGILAWAAAGLPVIQTDPATGQPRK